jgi:peptidoglycan hydrolase CwlO-like protein
MEKKDIWKGFVLMAFIGIYTLCIFICTRNILSANKVREIERAEFTIDSLENELNAYKSRMDSTIYLYDSKIDSILKNDENLIRRANYLQRQINEINADLDAFD